MGLAPLGVLDLSIVTDTLISMLENYVATASPLWQSFNPISSTDTSTDTVTDITTTSSAFDISYSGAMPDAVRNQTGCQLTFSLFHVAEDKFQRNSPMFNQLNQPGPQPGFQQYQRAQPIPYQPLTLDLYYLLSAYANQYKQEQQAMSMAMQFFYQTPIVKFGGPVAGIAGPVFQEFVISMEMESSDELARLWQAITVPLRLAVVYKVSVIFLTPPAAPGLALPVTSMQLAADSAAFPYSQSGQVIGTVRTVTFASLKSTVAQPVILSINTSPAVAVPGPNLRFILYGANLNVATSNNVYLTTPDGTEFNVTGWLDTDTTLQTASRMTLRLPPTVGALPTNAPEPGIYQLSAGCDAPTKYRTNSTPFSVAAWVDTSSVPKPNPPILAAVGGTYMLAGQGFVSGQTEILLDTVALDAAQVTVASSNKVTFVAPLTMAPGTYAVRVRVNNVETPPCWWVVIV